MRFIRDICWILQGKLSVQIISPEPEKFVNSCKEKHISISGIKYGDASLGAEVSTLGLIRAHRTGICRGHRIKILRRYGFIRNLLPFRKRPVFFFGFALGILFLCFMSGFVWEVEIEPGGLNDRSIARTLSDLGLHTGAKKNSINNEYIKNLMLLSEDKLGWLAVNIEGCTAKVSYSLKREEPELIAKTTPCDIVAKKQGIIKAVNVYKGTATVTAGETVMPGDILVSSTVRIGNDYSEEYIYHDVHARGEIYARTWYEISAYSSSVLREKSYTEQTDQCWYIKFGEKRINLSPGYGNYSIDCDIIIKEYSLGFGATLCRESRRSYETLPLSSDDAETERLELALTEVLLLSMEDGRIVASSLADKSEEGVCCVRLTAECIEQIGVQREHITNDNWS